MANGNYLNDNTQRVDGVTTDQESIVISTAAYAVGDVLGGLIEFDVYRAGGGGRITDFYLEDVGNQSAEMTLYFFDKKPTVVADNLPWETNMTIDDLKALIKEQDVTTYTVINSIGKVHIPMSQDFEGNKIYMYAVMGEITTYPAATNITMSLTCLLN